MAIAKPKLKQVSPPMTIGQLIGLLEKADGQVKEIAVQDKAARAVKADYERQIIEMLDKQETRVGEYGGRRVSISESDEPNITDWDAFLAWAKRTNNLHLVQRRLSAPSWRELRALKKAEIPGTEVYVKRSLSFTKVVSK